MKLKPGDLVCYKDLYHAPRQYGIVVRTNINMWGVEITPTGVEVKGCEDYDTYVTTIDCLELVSEAR